MSTCLSSTVLIQHPDNHLACDDTALDIDDTNDLESLSTQRSREVYSLQHFAEYCARWRIKKQNLTSIGVSMFYICKGATTCKAKLQLKINSESQSVL